MYGNYRDIPYNLIIYSCKKTQFQGKKIHKHANKELGQYKK